MTQPRVEIARVEDKHLPALAEFYRQVWNPSATLDTVRESRARAAASNPVTPGEAPPTWLVLREDRAIGHVTTLPLRLWLGGRERPAYWVKGLWVLPEYQSSSVGFLVLRAAAEGLETALALVHEPAARRLFGALGFTDLGGLPNQLRVLHAGPVLSRLDVAAGGLLTLPAWLRPAARAVVAGARLCAPAVDALITMAAALATGPLLPARTDVTRELDRAATDELWSAARPELRAAPVRGSAELAHRYANHPDYLFVQVRVQERLVGFGVVKRPREDGDPRLRGIRVATLSDLLYRPSQPRVGLALLVGAEAAARQLGADALLCGASAAAIQHLTLRRGYLRLPTNLHVLARIPTEQGSSPARLDQWWVTRGDSQADGSF